MLFIKYSGFFSLEYSSIESSSSSSSSLSEEEELSISSLMRLFLFLFRCTYDVLRTFVENFFFNFTNWVKYYYAYPSTINIFWRSFFVEKICIVFTVIISLIFKYFCAKTIWASNAFSMMLLSLAQILLYFSNNSLFLISKDIYLVSLKLLTHPFIFRSVMHNGLSFYYPCIQWKT